MHWHEASHDVSRQNTAISHQNQSWLLSCCSGIVRASARKMHSSGKLPYSAPKPVGWRHASLRVPRPSAKTSFQAPLHSPSGLYEHALELSRQEQYEEARAVFEDLLHQYPSMCKAWVSYAQMERRLGRIADPFHFHMARQILQKGLQLNPDSGCLAQAWGLLELQKGNLWAAIRLLERSVDLDPVLAPVLRWKPVHAASQHVRSLTNRPRGLSTNSSSNSRAVRTVCASSRAPAAQAGAAGNGQVASTAGGACCSGGNCSMGNGSPMSSL